MILAQHGIRLSEKELTQTCFIDSELGVDPNDLLTAATFFSLYSEARVVGNQDLIHLTQNGIYPIVFTMPHQIDPIMNVHAVIVRRIAGKFVYVVDPLLGRRRLPLEEFEKVCSAVGSWAVIVTQDCKQIVSTFAVSSYD